MRVMVEEPGRGDVGPDGSTRPDASVELAMGLQLLRASTLTSTRLQLALARRDRRVAMTALDTLAAIDGEIEGLVDRLAGPDAATPELAAIGAWLAEEKAAAVADKLNLACDARGPGLVSSPDRLSEANDAPDVVGQTPDEVIPADTAEPASSRRWWLLGLAALMLAVIAGMVFALGVPNGGASAGIAAMDRLFGG